MSQKKQLYKIKDWIFDPQVSELSRGTDQIIIPNKVAQVLLALLEAPNGMMTKHELMESVWKNTIVTGNSLDKSISGLRKFLGDSSVNPQYIETLPRKGYRLIADYEKIDENPLLRSRRLRNPFMVIATVMIICIIAIKLLSNNSHKGVLAPNGNLIASFERDQGKDMLKIENLRLQSNNKIDSFPEPETYVIGWSKDSSKLIYNTTEKGKDFYSLRIYNLISNSLEYIKFSREDDFDLSEIRNANKPKSNLEHYKVILENNTVHYIVYAQKDTIKVLLNQGVIEDFQW